MKVVSFVEGAMPHRGAIGMIGIPLALKSLAERGHDVVLLVGGPVIPGTEQYVVDDVNNTLVPAGKSGRFAILAFKAWPFWAFAPSMIIAASRCAREADLIQLSSLYSFPVLLGYLLARMYRKPYELGPHGVLAPVQRKVSAKKKWLYDKLVGRRILENASAIFYTATGERDEAAPLRLRAPSVIVPNGLEIREFIDLPARGQFRRRFLDGHTGPLVIFLARLNAKKGLDLLIQAMARVIRRAPTVRLAIIGAPDPPLFGRQVETWVSQNGIEANTVLTGLVTAEEKLQALADADVFVLPSHAENFGFSVFEAMASRVPVVVSDTLNYAEEIQSSGAGMSVRRDPDEFAGAILQLLEDGALRQRMGENGFRLARSYSWENAAEKMESAMSCLIQNRPLPAELVCHRSLAADRQAG